MAYVDINLTQPKPTDIYNIEVYNTSLQVIQDVINSLGTDVNNLQNNINQKFPFYYLTKSDNIDNKLPNGIYYALEIETTGTLPEDISKTNYILISIGTENNDNIDSIQTLITSDAKLFQRHVRPGVVGDWNQFDLSVIDNLTTQSSNQALSANQGYLLNLNKIGLYYPELIDLDSPGDTGLFVCNQTQVTGTVPSFMSIDIDNPENNYFIFESYGKDNETVIFQRISDAVSTKQGYRFKTKSQNDSWIWSKWLNVNSGGSTGDISLELVDL